jgi:hypothetical protein
MEDFFRGEGVGGVGWRAPISPYVGDIILLDNWGYETNDSSGG